MLNVRFMQALQVSCKGNLCLSKAGTAGHFCNGYASLFNKWGGIRDATETSPLEVASIQLMMLVKLNLVTLSGA